MAGAFPPCQPFPQSSQYKVPFFANSEIRNANWTSQISPVALTTLELLTTPASFKVLSNSCWTVLGWRGEGVEKSLMLFNSLCQRRSWVKIPSQLTPSLGVALKDGEIARSWCCHPLLTFVGVSQPPPVPYTGGT